MLVAGLFGARRVLGMRRVFFGVLGVDTLIVVVFFVNLGRNRCRGGLDDRRNRRIDVGFRHRRFAGGMTVVVLDMRMAVIV